MFRYAHRLRSRLPDLDISFTHNWLPDLSLGRIYNHSTPQSTTHVFETEDDVTLGIKHYQPRDHTRNSPPVVLLHGLALSHRLFTFPEHHSPLDTLLQAGYECYVPDLRGRGLSDVPETAWGFRDYLQYDLPAIVDFVRGRTPHDSIQLIGYSMGGMLYLAYEGLGRPGISRGITIGSPVRFEPSSTIIEKIGALFHVLPVESRSVPVVDLFSCLGLLTNPVHEYLPRFPLLNRDNIERGQLHKIPSLSFGRTSSRILTEYAYWIVQDVWSHEEKDYRANLTNVSTPTMAVAGTDDPFCFAPRHTGLPSIDAKTKFYAPCQQGRRYSHIDLLVGTNAEHDVYPAMIDWLK